METSPPAEFRDEQLVILAQKGERQAFEALVERYKKKAYRIAFHFTRDREQAKDLSQEAFLRAYTHLNNFDRRASFYTWFYRILVNICLDERRRSGRIVWETLDEKAERAIGVKEPADPFSSPDRAAMAGEVSKRVGAALETLPSKQRIAFLLRNHQGLSIREIATVMRTAEGTVKVHLHRAVIALRRKLAGVI